jgi:hypothetical protein
MKTATLAEIEEAAQSCAADERAGKPWVKAIESLKTTHGWDDESCREVERRVNQLIAQ